MKSILAIAALLSSAGARDFDSGVWRACKIDSVSICTPAGCAPRKPTISIYVSDFLDHGVERASYYRCGIGLTNCDRYSPRVQRNGDFLVFTLAQESSFAKLGPDDRLTDVTAVKDTVIVSRGLCEAAAPPRDLRSR